MRSVVTGGAGFIGSNLVDALLAAGDEVCVLDDLSSGRRENLRDALAAGATLVQADVSRPDAVLEVFEGFSPERVFHLAAQIDVRRSVQDPLADAAVNVLGMLSVLEAARKVGVRRLVNSSTGGGLYGEADLLPTPEPAPIRPLAPYGQAKRAAEGYCELYQRLHGLSTISLRYGNVYGPRQDVHGEAGVVAVFCGCALEGRTPTVYGDGAQTRDWVEVSDVVRANLLAAGTSLSGPVNIGQGQETSVLELLQALSELTGGAIAQPDFAPARAGEVKRSCLDPSRAYEELGWQAQVQLRTGLERILAAAGAPGPPAEPSAG